MSVNFRSSSRAIDAIAEFDAKLNELSPDRRVMQRHLTRAFGYMPQAYPGGLLELRAIHPTGRVRVQLFDCDASGIAKAARWAARRNAHGFNVYFGINPRRPGTRRNRAASAADVEVATAHVLDLDGARDTKSVIAKLTPPPRIIVTTGTIPNRRAHIWWFLNELQRDLPGWSNAQSRLATANGGDPSVSDPARVMRLAGSLSFPNASKRARGYVTELTALLCVGDAARTVSPDDVTHLCGGAEASDPSRDIEAEDPFAEIPHTLLPAPPEERVKEALSWIPPDVKRLEWIKVCAGLRDWQCETGADGFALFLEWSRGDLRRDGPQEPDSFVSEDDCRRAWESLRDSHLRPATIASVLHMAREHDWPDKMVRDAGTADWHSRLLIESMKEAASASRPSWLVHELLTEGTVNLVLGPPASGKTLVALLLAISIAAGSDFAGRDVRRGPALYLAAEDAGSIRRRLAALLLDHGDVPGLYLLTAKSGAPDLRKRETEDAQALLSACAEFRPALVVVDTYAAATPGADENNGAEMGAAYALLSEIASRGPTVLVLHHPKKGGSDDARGHGSQVATVATAIAVEKGSRGLIRARVVKARDASPDQSFAFRVETREVGTDAKGRAVSAAIAVEADAAEVAAARQPRSAREVALSVLRAQAATPEGIAMEAAIGACIAAGVSAADTPADQRRAARRAINDLVRDGLLRSDSERLHLPTAITEGEAEAVFGGAP
ncbi:AAA family ATPase [Neoroseomonas rubea]|uniref:AAA family ATPase n=1 Tax=Neoroseomonas rubea TaxID=2748666 RepID=UPI0018DF1251|nr:AAA family ATPase [Roseomonas rubea]